MKTSGKLQTNSSFIFTPLVLLVAILIFTNPQHIVFPLLLIPFLLVFISTFFLARYVYVHIMTGKKYHIAVPLLISLFPVLLLLLRSLRQLRLIDVLVVTALLVGVLMYVRQLEYTT